MTTKISGYQLEPIGNYKSDVRAIFRQTFFIGRPLETKLDNYEMYESLCLDWYLNHHPEGSSVCIDRQTNVVVGYVLVCTMPADYAEWLKKSAQRLFRKNFFHLLTLRMSRQGFQFYFRRFLDAMTVNGSRHRLGIENSPHVHMNLLPSVRSGAIALHLLSFADDQCRQVGFESWIGEINSFSGRRSRAVERFVGDVIHVAPNRTASYFLGQKVERLTVLRTVIQE